VITGGFDFIAVMFGLCGVLVAIEQRYAGRFFRWFPSIVLVMFASMALYTAGLWEMTDEVRLARTTVRDNLIPAMLFLMSLVRNPNLLRGSCRGAHGGDQCEVQHLTGRQFAGGLVRLRGSSTPPIGPARRNWAACLWLGRRSGRGWWCCACYACATRTALRL